MTDNRRLGRLDVVRARTFREQVRALSARYARRTLLRLTATVGQLAITLAGRAGAAVLAGLGVVISRSRVLRVVMALPLPPTPTASTMWRCAADTATPRC